jgi:hypothetical protein
MPAIPAFSRLRQEDLKFKVSLIYTARLNLRGKEIRETQHHQRNKIQHQ